MTVNIDSLEWTEFPLNTSIDFRAIDDDWTYTITTTDQPNTVKLSVSKEYIRGISYFHEEEVDVIVLEEKLNELHHRVEATVKLAKLKHTSQIHIQTQKHLHRGNVRSVLENVTKYNTSN